GQWEADARLLRLRLWVARLVLICVRHGDMRPVGDEDGPAVPLPLLGEAVLQLLGRPPGQRAQHGGGEAGAGGAVAGRVGRARLQASGGAVGNDSGHGGAAAVVVAEDLAEEAPDGGDGAEQPVAVLDAVLVEGVEDAGLGQGVGEGQSLVAREAGADLLKAGHGGASKVVAEVVDGRGATPEAKRRRAAAGGRRGHARVEGAAPQGPARTEGASRIALPLDCTRGTAPLT